MHPVPCRLHEHRRVVHLRVRRRLLCHREQLVVAVPAYGAHTPKAGLPACRPAHSRRCASRCDRCWVWIECPGGTYSSVGSSVCTGALCTAHTGWKLGAPARRQLTRSALAPPRSFPPLSGTACPARSVPARLVQHARRVLVRCLPGGEHFGRVGGNVHLQRWLQHDRHRRDAGVPSMPEQHVQSSRLADVHRMPIR